jgi:hypothetical protein
MTDRLEALLAHFSVSARVFNTGALCGLTELDAGDSGRMHLIRAGEADVHHPGGIERVTRPSLLLFPRPLAYRFVTDPTRGADFACARMHFSGGAANPIAAALPDFTCLALDDILGAGPVLDLLFDEASNQYCGRQAVLDRLFEVVLVQVLRHLMEGGPDRRGHAGRTVAPAPAPCAGGDAREPGAGLVAGGARRACRHVAQRFCECLSRHRGLHAGCLPAALAHRPGRAGTASWANAGADRR